MSYFSSGGFVHPFSLQENVEFRLGNPKLTLCSGSALREVKLKTSEPLLVASLKTLFYALSLWNDYSFLNVGVSVCIYHCTKKLGCILFKPAGPGEA